MVRVSEIVVGEKYLVWKWLKGVRGARMPWGWQQGFPGVRAHFEGRVVGRNGRKVIVERLCIPALSRNMGTLKVMWGEEEAERVAVYPYGIVRKVSNG